MKKLLKVIMSFLFKVISLLGYKITKFLLWDKTIHYFYGLGLTALLRLLMGLIGRGYEWTVAFPLVLIISIVNELYDKNIKGTGFNCLDIIASVLGSLTYLISLIVKG